MQKDAKAPARLHVSLGQFSSAGRKSENQDFHGAILPEGRALTLKGIALAIADGISSSKVSAEAAETTVKSLLSDYYATPESWTVKTAASRVISASNAWLHGRNAGLGDMDTGRVCTLSAMILKGREAHLFHIGDSRIQRLVGKSLEPLTVDHRVRLSQDESYLGRALGVEPNIEIDYRKLPLTLGDLFMLSTDGVHEVIDGKDVLAALDATETLEAAAQRLVEVALEKGSNDNLTVQLVRIDSLPEGGFDVEAVHLPIPRLPRDGDVIDGFRILRPIHATARSHVFLAIDPEGNRVALKIPATETGADQAYLRRFMLEDWIARRIASPHVLRAAALPETRSALYVASEYFEGQTLRQWMVDHPRPDLVTVRQIAEQIASGLRAIHRREMVHQDIRPENIMIDAEGTVKIIDLGSVSVAGVEEAAPGTLGEMPGTYQYTAPEYFTGDVLSWRSDQFALAAIVYEMLTGRLPYGTQVARIQSRRDQARLRYTSARDDDSAVPGWVDLALRRASHPDPVLRYHALSEFMADLKRPGAEWQAQTHRPLMARNPLRFWQGLSAALGGICVILALRLIGG
ncbi:protein kinase domain-containing protein [Celeribacter sp. SCSIO 80788]|uniref:protein kinase domain-containing protein n=1 Tax=Celeribacter sp. SCSIO 80788 TaxID=3117013 RepID=UPI003DA6B8F9